MAKISDMIVEDLCGAGFAPLKARRAAEILAEKGWQKASHGDWLRDEPYELEQEEKSRFTCSKCGTRRTTNKCRNFYMKYCPECGARMRNVHKDYEEEDKQL